MQNSLVERDRNVIWHPYTQMKIAPDPLPIVRGEGSWLIDESGKRYIDAISNWWVTLHGHAHPYLAQKVYEQAMNLEQVIFAGFTHEPAVRLAERLLKILPGGLSKIFYSDNGSTAVEVALKMAIQYWRNQGSPNGTYRRKILALSDSYHGDTFGAMSVSDRGPFTIAFEEYLFDVVFARYENNEWQVFENGSKRSLQHITWDEFVCFIYEPLVQGAGGMKMFTPADLQPMLQAAKENGVLLIADEVMTGFGRTGKLFASEYLALKPDIICLSKGITGGMMALGATACTQAIFDAFLSNDRMKTFFHGHSYTANPLACAAGNASLDLLLTEERMADIERIGRNHVKFLEEIRINPAVKNLRNLGTILAFEVDAGSDGYLNNISLTIHRDSLTQGVLIRPLGNTVYIMPPYCVTDEELAIVYNTVRRALNSL